MNEVTEMYEQARRKSTIDESKSVLSRAVTAYDHSALRVAMPARGL
jgi:hypothetical protein